MVQLINLNLKWISATAQSLFNRWEPLAINRRPKTPTTPRRLTSNSPSTSRAHPTTLHARLNSPCSDHQPHWPNHLTRKSGSMSQVTPWTASLPTNAFNHCNWAVKKIYIASRRTRPTSREPSQLWCAKSKISSMIQPFSSRSTLMKKKVLNCRCPHRAAAFNWNY